MRIIAGKYKGRQLVTVEDDSVRPATDRVKGSIFNSLQNRLNLHDALVLDLFAGSGSLGFEALSRGAAGIVFVDDSRSALDSIRKNAQALDCIDSCEIIHDDACSFIKHRGEQFDLIFADPPYAYEQTSLLPEFIFNHKLLKSEGFLIIEHPKPMTFESTELYHVIVRKKFGNTRITFFAYPQQHGV